MDQSDPILTNSNVRWFSDRRDEDDDPELWQFPSWSERKARKRGLIVDPLFTHYRTFMAKSKK